MPKGPGSVGPSRVEQAVAPARTALGAVASDSPHFIGHGGLIAGPALRQAFEQADVVLALGCRFSSWMWDERGPLVRREQALVCLLDALPVLTLIHDNEAWGIIRAGQKNALGFELGTSLAGTDYAAIARGFGCHGQTVSRPDEVAPAMPAFGSMNRYGFRSFGPG